MSAALTLVRQLELQPQAERPKPTLVERLREADLIAATLDAIADEEQPEEFRRDLEQQLRDTLTGTRTKIDNTAGVLAQFESDQLHCKREIARLTAREAKLVHQQEQLEGYVIHALTSAGLTKFDGHTSTLTVKKNAPSLVIEPGTEIPTEYMRYPAPPPTPPPAPDKNAIKAAMKRGIVFLGCRLAQTLKLERS